MQNKVAFVDLKNTEYKLAWDIQDKTLSDILENRKLNNSPTGAGTLFFVEHPHVFTLGKSGQINNLLINDDFLKKINATYYKSNRGGDITYHGPGQIVGYPIFDLDYLKIGIREYINRIEEAIINTLKEYTITATRLDGATGVWMDVGTPEARKLCAIGVRVSRAITMHGFALNVNTDLNYFSYINPCGFQDKGVTSMQKELGQKLDIEKVKAVLKSKIAEQFSLELTVEG